MEPSPLSPDGARADAPLLRVFVMGCSRGGTTVTQRLVADRLGLFTLPETRFFANLVGNLEPRMFPQTQRPAPLRHRITSGLREALGRSTGGRLLNVAGLPRIRGRLGASFGDMTAEFLAQIDAQARREQAAGWLEKTPFHVFYAPLIARLVPDAWMIHILRDAEETVGSIRDAAHRFAMPWATVYDRVERDVDNWNASTAASAAMVGSPRQIFLPYAALTRAPAEVLDRVALRIGRGTPPPPPRPAAPPAGITRPRDLQWKEAAISGTIAPAESKWDSALTEAERARARALIRPVPAGLLQEMAPFFALAGMAGGKAA